MPNPNQRYDHLAALWLGMLESHFPDPGVANNPEGKPQNAQMREEAQALHERLFPELYPNDPDPPTDLVVVVSTLAELQAKIASGPPTIHVTAGTYSLAAGININRKVTVKGIGAVTLRGAGATHGFHIFANDVTIDSLDFVAFRQHAIQVHGEGPYHASRPRILGCKFRDIGDQMLKVSYRDGEAPFSEDGVVDGCLFEYSSGEGPDNYIGGVDAHHAKNWIVRNSIFKSIQAPIGYGIGEHAIHFWSGSEGTLVEGNRIENCDRGIGFGLGNRGHRGGIISKNCIVHDGSRGDVAIELESAVGPVVRENTIRLEHATPGAIAARFPITIATIQDNIIATASGVPIWIRDGAVVAQQGNKIVELSAVSWDCGVVVTPPPPPPPPPPAPGRRITAADFTYLGAFRPPVVGEALTYCNGAGAYHDGRLWVVGHRTKSPTPVAEISIPIPLKSWDRNALPKGTLTQGPGPLQNFNPAIGDLEMIQSDQGPRLLGHFHHNYEFSRSPKHFAAAPSIASPQVKGPWYVGTADQVNHMNTNAYVAKIDPAWAAAHTPGMTVFCGRHREGMHSNGPTAIAFNPWDSGAAPGQGAVLEARPLVLYGSLGSPLINPVDQYCRADDWPGAAWIGGTKQALVIFGEHGKDVCWYGWRDSDGTRVVVADCGQFPDDGIPCKVADSSYGGSNRGYQADRYEVTLMLYDTEELAKVAKGEMPAHQIQPYEFVDLTQYMIQAHAAGYVAGSHIQVGCAAWDADGRILYLNEVYGSFGPVIHAFQVAG